MRNREAFEYFIENCTTSSKSVGKYVGALKKVSESLRNIADTGVSEVWDIDSFEEGTRIKDLLFKDPDFIEYNNNRGNNMYSAAYGWYLNFLQARQFFSSNFNREGDIEIDIRETSPKQFAIKTFSYLYTIDKFKAFWNDGNIESRNEQNSTIQYFSLRKNDSQIYLTGLFRADSVPKSGHYATGIPFVINQHKWYLPTIWYRKDFSSLTNNRNPYPISSLINLVNHYYPQLIAFEKGEEYSLQKKHESTIFTSKDVANFWNEVGQTVLSVDEGFSKLPLYYHMGHIRVKTKYGGAVNFSVGYYDVNSERVNKDISFQYDKYTDSQGNHTFYLNVDINDLKAFDRFIPVFNNIYQGLFEISFDGITYTFKDYRTIKVLPYDGKESRQVIYFGAPGTGKSFEVNRILKEKASKRYVRTTFHPDTDYSSFVGCYKPTMKDGQIEYSFTAQAFINAYIGAWSDISKPYYLVIEEINRGNCAQIFGDIFQLLDRNQDGESSYGIKPDTDLQIYIESKLGLITYLPEEIRNGDEMRLPRNLFIYATMNTSDQSLFPIDSAFKRRWDMRYTAIKPGSTDHVLVVGSQRYNWSSFISEVNKRIFHLTNSEDKQLGYWFIKPDENGEISWKRFVSKALFYLWNDVVKDYVTMEKEDSPFNKKFAFTTFYNEHGEPIIEQTVAFLDKLEVEKLPALNSDYSIDDIPEAEVASELITEYSDENSSDEDSDNQDDSGRDNTKYQINGSGKIDKKYLAYELIKQYIKDHPEESAFEVVKAWKSLGDLVPHFVELQEEFDKRTDKEPRIKEIECNGEKIYVSTNGWGGKAKMQELISAIEAKDWRLNINEYQA